jgi:hypothetical protein
MTVTNQVSFLESNGTRSHLQQSDTYQLVGGNATINKESLVLFPCHNTDDTSAGKRMMFPERLFRMLEDIDKRQVHLSHIVSWQHSGRAFVIHKPAYFVSQVMPIYFRTQNKLSSFQRQLANYGFQRYQEEEILDRMIYYHEQFAFYRETPLLLQHVVLKSKTTKMNSVRSLSRLLQMTKKTPQVVASTATSCLPQEPAHDSVHVMDTVTTATLPLPFENLGDHILDDAATELLWRREEACDDDFCINDDFDCQQHHGGIFWDPELESLESLEDETWSIFMRFQFE